MTVNLLEQTLAQLMLFQQMAKVEDGGLVGHRFRQPQAREPAYRLGLVQQVLHAGVAEVVEELDAVDPQHYRQRVGPASVSGLGVAGPDTVFQTLPGNQPIHPFQEDLAAGSAFLALIFQIGKAGLVHLLWSLLRHHGFQPQYAIIRWTCSEIP